MEIVSGAAVERDAGRMSVNEYAHVRWHLDGRVAAPAFEGVQKERSRKGGKEGSGVIRF
jgi:hypothetical protein